MANELINLEQQLLELKEMLRQQLEITNEEQSEEALESLQRIESSKQELHTLISESIVLVSQLSVDTNEVANTIQLLDAMNGEIQRNLVVWYDGSSLEMKSVKNQRKTLQTYGGVAQGEVVSLYIDYKK